MEVMWIRVNSLKGGSIEEVWEVRNWIWVEKTGLISDN